MLTYFSTLRFSQSRALRISPVLTHISVLLCDNGRIGLTEDRLRLPESMEMNKELRLKQR